jgi:hypothetical protein
MSSTRHFFLSACALALSTTFCPAAEVYFSFGGKHSGIGRLVIQENQIKSVEAVDPGFPVTDPYKLANARAAGIVGVATGGDKKPALILLPCEGGEAILVPLPAEVSDVAAADDLFLVATAKGRFVVIDAATGSILSELNARKALEPPGRKGEFIRILPGGENALVSFQKDDDNSSAKGNRIVLLQLNPLEVRADIPLPRSNEDLHIPGNSKEQGPGPEVVMVCQKSNTLAVTLDLYGAVAFADLTAALQGKLENLSYVPTASDGSWGSSFPDRATLVEVADKEYLLVSNAAAKGGLAIFDVEGRSAIQHLPAAAGAEAPIDFPQLLKAVTIVSGKLKSRSDEGLEKESATANGGLMIIDYAGLGGQAPATVQKVDLGFMARRIACAGGNSVAVFGGEEVVLVDIIEKNILDRKPLPGPVIRALATQTAK